MIKKCEICGKKFKALPLHMKAHKNMEDKIEEGKYVKKEDFDILNQSVLSLIEMIKGDKKEENLVNNQIKELAKHDEYTEINPKWEALAREILGEKLDHCEVYYPDSGGLQFSIFIKKEFSNAPKEYLERYKVDKRTKEIGHEGIQGVESWAKLVKSNLDKH